MRTRNACSPHGCTMKLLSIVVPVYNEEANVEPLYQAVNEVLQTVADRYAWEFVFTDNGSGVPDTIIRKELLIPDDSNRGILNERMKEPLQPAWLNKRVIVKEDNVFRRCGPSAAITSAREEHVPRISQTSNTRLQGLQVIPTSVGGAIVHNYDFAGSGRSAGKDRL